MTSLFFITPYFFCIGIFVGMLSMLFGIGGGLIIVPFVFIFFLHQGYNQDLAMKIAIATSLITIMTSTLNVLYKQNKAGKVLWALVGKFIPFVVIGGFSGVLLAHRLSGVILNDLFVFFLALIIIYALIKKDFDTPYQLHDFKEPSWWNKGCMGFFVGNLSILIGIGGNIVLVPYLRHFKLPMKNATAFTVAVMPILALIGSIGYIMDGLENKAMMPPYSWGYINFPAFVLIQLGSFLGAVIGQKLLKHMNDKRQARLYVAFLIIIFLIMIISSTDFFKHF
jgi:uncharacterized membrane protein YfcA